MQLQLLSALPMLETPDLILRQLVASDAKDIFAYASNPHVSRYVFWEPHRTILDSRSMIRYMQQKMKMGEPSSWGIVLKETQKVIGTIGFVEISHEHQCAEVGYSLDERFWNHGYATQALARVLNFAFLQLQCNRVEAFFNVQNPASGRVMEKNGMHYEGTMKEKYYCKGEYIDVSCYALTRGEYLSSLREGSRSMRLDAPS